MTAEGKAEIRAPPHKCGANIITRRVGDIQADCVSNHERDRFGFELARVTRSWTVVAVVKQFVRLCASKHKRAYVLQLVMSSQIRGNWFP